MRRLLGVTALATVLLLSPASVMGRVADEPSCEWVWQHPGLWPARERRCQEEHKEAVRRGRVCPGHDKEKGDRDRERNRGKDPQR